MPHDFATHSRRLRLPVVLLTILALVAFALPSQAPTASAAPIVDSIRIEPIAAYNFIVDSNVLSPSTYAPEAGTLAAKVCNDGATAVNNLSIFIGDYDPNNDGNAIDSTPGIYPGRTNPPGLQGTYRLTHEGGTAGTRDASRFLPSLAAGTCAIQYWLVSYPRTGPSDGTIVGSAGQTVAVTLNIKPADDLYLFYDVWATGTRQGGATSTVETTRRVTMRNEISAAANKIWPNTTAKVPQAYLDAIATALGWNTLTPSGGTVAYPGQTVTTQGIWYDLGNVGFGFDNNSDGAPDQNAWLQPIGDPDSYDPGCFRLVRTYGILIIKLKSGGEQLIPFVDQLYFENIPENTGAVGLVYYQYAALDGSCTAGLSPYQEVASGYDNEKFSGDYGFGIPPLQSRTPSVSFVKGVNQTSIPASPTTNLNYTITFQNTAAEAAPNQVSVGDPALGIPLVISDTIPDGTDYVANSATAIGATVSPSGVKVAQIRYSTDNGATWTTTQPAASTVTTIQWWMDRPVPQGDTVTLGFSAQAPVAPPTVSTISVIPNTASASFGTAPPFARSTVRTLVQGPNSLSGNVFRDNGAGGLFGNSTYDSTGNAETLLPNVSVDLYYDVNGNGTIESTDVLVTSTAATYTGAYSFGSLADGNYIVQVNTGDADITQGWTNTTRTLRTAALDVPGTNPAAVTVSNLNFGFAPALTLDKDLITPTSPLYEGELVTFGIDLRNTLPGSGTSSTACSYVIPSTIIFPTNNPVNGEEPSGGGPTNSQWSTPNNAAGLPDGSYAGTNMANNADFIGLSGFNLGDQGGTITSVEYRITVRERVEMRSGDYMRVRVYYNNTEIAALTRQFFGTDPLVFTGGAGTTYTLNIPITSARAWTWADFSNNLTEMQIEGTSAGGNPAGELDLDSAAFVVTTSGVCGGDNTIISTLPLTDTFDTARLQFVSSIPPVDSSTPAGTLTWNNLGPLYPGQQKVVQTTFRVLQPTSNGQATTNYAGTTSPRFANGRLANNAYDNTPVTINYDGSIAGRVFKNNAPTTWQTGTGDDGTDVGFPNVRVELFGCVNNSTGALYTVAGGTNPSTTNRDCAGQDFANGNGNGIWRLLATTNTDTSGNYTFTGLRPGFYVVQVADGSAVLSGGTSTTTLPTGAAQNLEASDTQVANDGFTCGGGSPCNGLWGDNTANLATSNFNAIDTTDETINNVDFGYSITGAMLYGTVWHDYDANGTINGNEPRLAGVTVWRCATTPCGSGNAQATATTDANGGYSFTNLSAGTYYIGVGATTGPLATGTWTNTFDPSSPFDSQSGAITIVANSVNGAYNYGYRQTGTLTIGDTVYYDWDADGTQDNGAIVEEGAPNVTVLLYLDVNADGNIDTVNDRLVATTTTDGSGGYLFSNLPAGRYYVFVDRNDPDLRASYPQTQDPDEAGVCVTCNNRGLALLTNASNLNQDFGYRPVGTLSIGDTVWYDRNGDGVQSGVQETGIPNVTVSLQVDLNNDTTFVTVRSAVTDASGKYLFNDLPSGLTYRVVVDAADPDIPNDPFGNNYAPSTPTTRTYSNLAADNLTADFGFTTLGAIGDTVYYDVNNNGQQDFNEPGIGGVTVTLTNVDQFTGPNGTVYAPGAYTANVVTSASGKYLFSGLPAIPSAGSGVRYTVTVSAGGGTPINGQPQTADPDRDGQNCASTLYPSLTACDNATTQRIYPGTVYTGADFGYLPTGVLGDTVWIDADSDNTRDANEYGIPYVTVRLIGPGCAGPTGCVTETDVNGEYFFIGLANGSYTVSVVTTDPDMAPLVADGLVATYDPDGGNDSTTAAVMSGGNLSTVGSTTCAVAGTCNMDVDFGYRYSSGTFTVSGTLCRDTATPDGVCGAGDSGVSTGEGAYVGETVWLYRWSDNNSNGVRDSGEMVLASITATNASGDYSFANLPAASGTDRYVISIVAPTSSVQMTTPLSSGDPAVCETVVGGATQCTTDTTTVTSSALRSFTLTGNRTNQDFAFLSTLSQDFGDLPASYSTTINGAPDGARHTISGSLYLGSTATDAEPDGQASVDALGDGTNDENGVTIPNTTWTNGATGGSVRVTVAGSGWLVAWADWNRDGRFGGSNELVINRAVSTGTADYTISVPAGFFPSGTGVVSNLAMRFRLFSSQPSFAATAFAGDGGSGEVEDYIFGYTPTPVTLTSFTATRVAGGVRLDWSTSTEVGTAGYNLLRSATGERADAEQLNPEFIPAYGDSMLGGDYSYVDADAMLGTSYSYWLEVVDADGTTEEYGPVTTVPKVTELNATKVYLPLIVR